MEIVECTFTTPFFSTFIVGMDGFANPHNFIVQNNTFPTLHYKIWKYFKNEDRKYMLWKIEMLFSQVEGDSNL